MRGHPEAGEASNSYTSFDRHTTYAALSAGTAEGVLVRERPGGAGEVGLATASTPPHTALDGSGLYNGGRYHRSRLTSPVYETIRFDTLIPSWQATTPAGTWLEIEMRVRCGGEWTDWFTMGVWASGTESVERHSVDGQEAGNWRVLTDTLQSTGPVYADAYRYRLTLYTEEWGVSPAVRGVCVSISDSRCHGECLEEVPNDGGLWGRELAVPERSQMVYPNGGEEWCSPVSLSMAMAYWADKTGRREFDWPVPVAVRGTHDYTHGGNGNWSFNTAYASSLGLDASVVRCGSLGEVERWVAAGVPVVASIAWERGGLYGAPIPESEGHLLVIRGFDTSGNVIANDPAGRDDRHVRRVYRRDEFARVWFHSGSGGVAYLVYPRECATPGCILPP